MCGYHKTIACVQLSQKIGSQPEPNGMNQIVTRGIVLRRTDYGEADRIVVFLTPDHGKVSVIAKGVRRLKSKLAGGIELFSVSSITYMPGRSDLGTLMSTRLDKFYGKIVHDIDRVQLGYVLIAMLNKNTEDEPEAAYFDMLVQMFASLDGGLSTELIRIWFVAQLMRLGGHTPNLQTDINGAKLDALGQYNFDNDIMAFGGHTAGSFAANHIKFLRLLIGATSPAQLTNIADVDQQVQQCAPLVNMWQQQYIH